MERKLRNVPKIKWRRWSKAIFQEAKQEGKPILLDIAASWCHWCQVMEKTTYSNDLIARLINENFIPVKVDTDKRPDINARYNLGGWPTTAFLMPDGTLITGGTYIAPADMQLLLDQVFNYFTKVRHGEKPPIFPEAGERMRPPLPQSSKEGLTSAIVDYFCALLTDNYDKLYGGFGYHPKFPFTGALQLLLILAAMRGNNFLNLLTTSLKKMAEGQIFDSINGGFFRYATQRDWSKPHYEKLLTDQAELLTLYLDVFLVTKEDFFAKVASHIYTYTQNVLSLERGFAGSQAADEQYYSLPPEAQKRTPPPSVDKTIYTAANCKMISAYLKTAAVFGLTEARNKALATVDFLIAHGVNADGLWAHYLENETPHFFGYLEDQAAALNCLIDTFETTGNSRYLKAALDLEHAIRKFNYHEGAGCFLDRPLVPEGALSEPLYPITTNADLSKGFYRLAKIVGATHLEELAKQCLNAFSESYRFYGLVAANYATAVSWILQPTLEIFITGDRNLPETAKIWLEVQRSYHPFKILKLAADYVSLPIAPEASLAESPGAFICLGEECLPPANNLESVRERLTEANSYLAA